MATDVPEPYWNRTGTVLEPYWNRTGTVLEPYWHGSGIFWLTNIERKLAERGVTYLEIAIIGHAELEFGEPEDGRLGVIEYEQQRLGLIIDLSVIRLLEDKKLKKSDFIVTENYHIRLKEHTAKALIEKIKLNMNVKVVFKGRNATYQTILFRNVKALATFILGKSETLAFEVPTSIINRNDTIDNKQRFVTGTPDERKRLGINKSTLWYKKKKLAEGKTVKIYGKVLSKLE